MFDFSIHKCYICSGYFLILVSYNSHYLNQREKQNFFQLFDYLFQLDNWEIEFIDFDLYKIVFGD